MSTTKKYSTCFNQNMEGVQPNIEFTPSVTGIASGKDAQLLFTQGLIIRQRRKKSESINSEKEE